MFHSPHICLFHLCPPLASHIYTETICNCRLQSSKLVFSRKLWPWQHQIFTSRIPGATWDNGVLLGQGIEERGGRGGYLRSTIKGVTLLANSLKSANSLNCYSERIPRRFCLTAVLRVLRGASILLARPARLERATYGFEGQGTEKFTQIGNWIYINFSNMTPIPYEFCENSHAKSYFFEALFRQPRYLTQ